MLDKIILGLLQLKSLSSYDLKKALENSVNHFYSTSYGSIHPALKKMEQKGWITGEEQSIGARQKKIYSISEKGRQIFNEWMATEIPVTRIKEDALVRMFFFGLIPKKQRIQLIDEYILKMQESLNQLINLKKKTEEKEIPQPFKEIAKYQVETLRFGIESTEYSKKWFEDFTKKER